MLRFRERKSFGSCIRQNVYKQCGRSCRNGGTVGTYGCLCPGNYGGECCEIACNPIENCDDVHCTTTNNNFCLKCAYTRDETVKAYVPAFSEYGDYPGTCQKICSWRSDSKFCYPGTCGSEQIPSSCVCDSRFGGYNCLQITEPPSVDRCTASFSPLDKTSDKHDIDCRLTSSTRYCPLRSSTLTLSWVVSFAPSFNHLGDAPYYVNETKFGISEATIEWSLSRKNTRVDAGTGSCLSRTTATLIPSNEFSRRICNHTIKLIQPSQDGDTLTLSVKAKNGGFIKINNYDHPTIVTVDSPKFYSPAQRVTTTNIRFDFNAPFHCVGNDMPCDKKPIDIEKPFTRSNVTTVKWKPEDWNDNLAGISHFTLSAYRLSSSTSGTLTERSDKPDIYFAYLPRTIQQATIELPSQGVYSIVLGAVDHASNVQKARRFVMFDDASFVAIDATRPITAREATINMGIPWLGVQKGKVTFTWSGHFFNAFHRDNKLLNSIQDFNPSLRTGYDEDTGQYPLTRSREEIPNDEGIIRYQFEYSDSRDKTSPYQWINVRAPKTEQEISISVRDTDRVIVWLRAYDVMGNYSQDKTEFLVDRSPPVINYVRMLDVDNKNMSIGAKAVDFSDTRVMIRAYDAESGIHKIKWEVLDGSTKDMYAYGEVNTTTTEKGCSPLECHCLSSVEMCYPLDFVISAESIDVMQMPDYEVSSVMRLSVVNNAMMEDTTDIELMVRAPPGAKASSGKTAGAVAGGVILALILLVVVLFVVLWKTRKLPGFIYASCQRSPANPPSASKSSNTGYGYRANVEHEVTPLKGSRSGAYPPSRPPKSSNVYSPKPKQDLATVDLKPRSKEDVELSTSNLEILELLKSGIYKAKAIDITECQDDTLVVVKTLKDKNSAVQKKNLLHELDIMLSITPHANIIRLLGCITEYGSPKPSIVMEYASNDTLCEFLRRSRKGDLGGPLQDETRPDGLFEGSDSLTSNQLMLFAEQIACGMEHLSNMDIIHRKLGARNIFVSEYYVCKIGSFAMAVRSSEVKGSKSKESRLPIRWMAPESMTRNEFSTKSDVWAYGVVIWEIITLGALPYPDLKNKEVAENVKSGYLMDKPPHCTQEIYTLMLRCWDPDVVDRPDFGQLVNDVREMNRNKEVVDLSQYDVDLYGDVNEL
ncbi:uncharacterized protein [Ptychodera flava]|uniref:uncharacterized protein n=1 Tax=Ptychodera flava TaxID=63121 RepID=UPI003969D3CB